MITGKKVRVLVVDDSALARRAIMNALASDPEIEVVGPTYWLLPPALFSDPTHTNPAGAREYTTRLWNLLRDRLQPAAAPVAAAP